MHQNHAIKPLQAALFVALAGALGLAQAATITSSSGFNLSRSQTDTTYNSTNATSTSNATLTGTAPSVSQFDASLGVLTGATVTLDSTRTQTVGGTAAKSTQSGFTAQFAGSSTGSFSATGTSTTTFGTVSATTSCSMPQSGQQTCTPVTGTSGPVNTGTSLSVSAGALNSYVGAGNVSGINFLLPIISANISGVNQPSTATASLNWAGTVAADYTYLLHAAASFDGSTVQNTLTLDFGTVLQGASISPLAFSLFNLAGDRVGLDVDAIFGTGDTGTLWTDVAASSALAQGGSLGYSAWLDTSSVGAFGATYTLYLSDEDVGASDSRFSYQLTLNLVGNVEASAVPVPAAVWLFGSGLLGLIGVARRKS